ncbi:MAG: PhoU domain-containing protein, partial [Acutalibacteraceae bacterium]
KVIDFLTHEITRYIVKINGLDIVDQDRKVMGAMYSAIQDLERIGDHSENICECVKQMLDKKMTFSEEALKEIDHLTSLASTMIEDGFTMFNTQNGKAELAVEVVSCEDQLDKAVETYKLNHIIRLNRGECSAESGMIFLDLLSNLERVGDHANNVAFSIPYKNKSDLLNEVTLGPSN